MTTRASPSGVGSRSRCAGAADVTASPNGAAACGCAVDPQSPVTLRNRPGQAAISHRAGTYSSFLGALHRALSRQPGLRGLTTRDVADPAIALLEAWAAVGEVLAFAGERYAQEGFLRTATTRDAVLLHARALGYELRPGLAASTQLAFTLDLPPDVSDEVVLPAGLAVQSVPGPGEQPQIFETAADLVGIRGLDDLRPARAEVVPLAHGDNELVLAGTTTGLRPGDRLLVVGAERLADTGSERWDFRRVAAVTPVDADPREVASLDPGVPAHTVVRLEAALGSVQPHVEPAGLEVKVHVLRLGVPLFGHAAQPWPALPVALRIGELEPGTTTVLDGVFKGREDDWVNVALNPTATRLELSRRVDGLVGDSWAVIADPSYTELLRVTGVAEETLADYLLTAEASVLTVQGENLDRFDRRTALVWCLSEEIQFGARPITAEVAGTIITLGRHVPALRPGRLMIVEGRRVDTDEAASELAVVHTVRDVAAPNSAAGGPPAQVTEVTLVSALAHRYHRSSVHIRANAVAATQGRSRSVVLGSGNGTLGFQRFLVPEPGITHIPPELASDPSPTEVLRGAASSLDVRVGGVSWQQVPTLYAQPPDATVFTARVRPGDGLVEVTFGDGVTGARLPTGRDNVTATYRVSVGLAGQVGAEQLALLLSRPLGLAGVRNPLPAAGAADPEPPDEARRNAPVTVRTLDRVVSLADVADFARSYAGVAKAAAAWLWLADERVVHVTISPADGSQLADGDPLLARVGDAIDNARHPGAPVVVAPHRDVPVAVRAGLVVHPNVVASVVLDAARVAVESAFAPAARALAQSLAASELLGVLHRVPGLVAVDLERLHPMGGATALLPVVTARPATVNLGKVTAADLVWLSPAALDLSQVSR